jgi:hypothetical protein
MQNMKENFWLQSLVYEVKADAQSGYTIIW